MSSLAPTECEKGLPDDDDDEHNSEMEALSQQIKSCRQLGHLGVMDSLGKNLDNQHRQPPYENHVRD